MQDAWHIIKWIWVAVFAVYLVVQIAAVWRFKGARKKRSTTIVLMMTVVTGVSDAVRSIFFFENRMADQIGMLVVGVAALVATTVLVGMFGKEPTVTTDGRDDAEQGDAAAKVELRADG